jgi:hypothetical protein
MKWSISAATALAFVALSYPYFLLRAHRDAVGGTVFVPAYAADIWSAILTPASALAVALGVVHARARVRAGLSVMLLLALVAIVFCFRSIEYSWSDGRIVERWLPLLPMHRSLEPLPVTEMTCFEISDFVVTFIEPQSGQRREVFRGVPPWTFESKELARIVSACP